MSASATAFAESGHQAARGGSSNRQSGSLEAMLARQPPMPRPRLPSASRSWAKRTEGAYLLPSLVGRFSGAARPILRAFAIPFEPSLDCHSSGCNDPTRRNEMRKSDENNVRHREDGSMNCTEKFRRFAAECRAMAEFTRSPESKATWDHLAARWVQCAESIDLKSSAAMLFYQCRSGWLLSPRRDRGKGRFRGFEDRLRDTPYIGHQWHRRRNRTGFYELPPAAVRDRGRRSSAGS